MGELRTGPFGEIAAGLVALIALQALRLRNGFSANRATPRPPLVPFELLQTVGWSRIRIRRVPASEGTETETRRLSAAVGDSLLRRFRNFGNAPFDA
eukprot:9471694-Pyramimonas_sp.AAC.1